MVLDFLLTAELASVFRGFCTGRCRRSRSKQNIVIKKRLETISNIWVPTTISSSPYLVKVSSLYSIHPAS